MENDDLIILDFETTGMSADQGARIIEVGAARIVNGEICDTFSSLCDPGERIPSFITNLTGISNQMVAGKPSPEEIMEKFRDFMLDSPILAHNASFDRRFLRAEMRRIGHQVENPFLCTMLLARRLMQEAPNHKLGTLRRHIGFRGSPEHKEHRALDDVRVTAALWKHMHTLVREATGNQAPPFSFFQKLTKSPKHLVEKHISHLTEA